MGNANASPAPIKVFVASPDDVAPEREILERMIRDLNAAYDIVPNPPPRLELCRWEKAYPSAGRPQDVIFKQIGAYDVFVGLMWRRFGTPTGKARSGTKEEYDRARERWQKRKQPQIMFYFSTAAASPPRTVAEAKQLMQVVRFRAQICEQQLIGEYDGTRDFESVIRPHLLAVLRTFAEKLEKQRRKRERVLDQGRRGMMQAVSIAAGRPRQGNGGGRKEDRQWHKPVRSRKRRSS